MSDTNNDISFEEFVQLCEEAGISTDNLGQMEQDFRVGKSLAEVTDALIEDQEGHPAKYTAAEHVDAMDSAITLLGEGGTAEGNRKVVTRLAVHALRFLAECTYDEGQN